MPQQLAAVLDRHGRGFFDRLGRALAWQIEDDEALLAMPGNLQVTATKTRAL